MGDMICPSCANGICPYCTSPSCPCGHRASPGVLPLDGQGRHRYALGTDNEYPVIQDMSAEW